MPQLLSLVSAKVGRPDTSTPTLAVTPDWAPSSRPGPAGQHPASPAFPVRLECSRSRRLPCGGPAMGSPHRHAARSPSRTCLLSCPSAYVHLTRKQDLAVPLSDSNGLPRGDGTQTAHRGRQAEPCHAWRSAAAAPFSGRLRLLWVVRAKSSSVPSALLLPELFAGIFSLLQAPTSPLQEGRTGHRLRQPPGSLVIRFQFIPFAALGSPDIHGFGLKP